MNVAVKGWCPGALRPMESGDGLIVRVRPWCSTLTLSQARGIADAAEAFGNGLIDLTRRANLQIRGVTEATLSGLHPALDRLNLLDSDAEAEGVRNVMVGPLAGGAARALAAELTTALTTDTGLRALPAKFGWLVDDSGIPSILDRSADVALCLMDQGVALRLGRRWVGLAPRDSAVASALALASNERLALAPLEAVPMMSAVPMGIVAPFGRLDALQLRQLVELAQEAGASEVRLSPWRALYFDRPVGGAERLGLIVDASDPLLRIDACPGAPSCRSASVDTRRDARRLAAKPFTGTIHVSGCSKGCARSTPADLVLVGDKGRYGVIRNGTTNDRIGSYVGADEL
jgi:precorrin-3B synthase